MRTPVPGRQLLLGLSSAICAPIQSRAEPRLSELIGLALVEGLSVPFANAGEAVHCNLLWAVERVNRRGGVPVGGRLRPLELVRHDSKGQIDEAPAALRAAFDEGALAVLQGN